MLWLVVITESPVPRKKLKFILSVFDQSTPITKFLQLGNRLVVEFQNKFL